MIISLTGFMGCGKSSVGRKLSELLCCPFVDLDAEIEKKVGRSIPEIFSTEGETFFRNIEKDILTDIVRNASTHENDQSAQLILALGGGAVMTPESEQIIHSDTMCIYLKASVDTLVCHLKDNSAERPLLKSDSDLQEHISNLMSKRSSTYERVAHLIADTDGKTIEEIALYLNNSL